MQLDRLSARIRPRTAWEGIDLGFALGRHWFVALWGLWWLCALPVGAAAALWLPRRPDLWLLLVWWLKPLYEAPLLFLLSRALFGELPGMRELWRHRSRVFPPRLLPTLLWRRLHFGRSFQLPLIQLEGLRGRERRRRQRVIQDRGGAAAWLTVICFHLESILWSSALVLVLVLVPEELPRLDPGAALFEVESAAYWISAALYWVAMSVMAPFYVAAGFALYLARRTELEAWDLELVFRKAGDEEAKGRLRGSALAGAAAVLILSLWSLPPAEAAARDLNQEQARSLVAEVLAQEDFGSRRAIRSWVYVGEPTQAGAMADLPLWVRDVLEVLAQAANLVATPVKWVLLLLAAVLLILAARRIALDLRLRVLDRSSPVRADRNPESLPRQSLEELPANLAGRVDELITAGDLRAALALLYRASLAHLERQRGLEIPESATEDECLSLVAEAGPAAGTDVLRRLTRAWQREAYGHLQPDRRELATLLRDWQGWQGGQSER
jgi:hypothetical protein